VRERGDSQTTGGSNEARGAKLVGRSEEQSIRHTEPTKEPLGLNESTSSPDEGDSATGRLAKRGMLGDRQVENSTLADEEHDALTR